MRKIEWKTPGSDTVHTISDIAQVKLVCDQGLVIICFGEDGSIQYEKFEIIKGKRPKLICGKLIDRSK